jgi:hypothetical protein
MDSSSYRKRVEKLEASQGSSVDAQARVAVERLTAKLGKLGMDIAYLSRPEVRAYMEKEARAGKIRADGGMLLSDFSRIFENLPRGDA